MTIQFYPDELDYVNASLSVAAQKVGSFLEYFLHACQTADSENYELLRPALKIIMEKYPAEPGRLAMEHLDRGVPTQEDLAAIAEDLRKRHGI